ncbi:AMP-binding protein [Rhodocyclaceae bacterium SMB388]
MRSTRHCSAADEYRDDPPQPARSSHSAPPSHSMQARRPTGRDAFDAAPTLADDACFWLYSSGSTGAPKGTVHIHSSLIQTVELYARPVLGCSESDVVFSAAKSFFAYGLGNGLTVGATAVLMAELDMDAVFAVADTIKVMVDGVVLESGPPEQIRNSPESLGRDIPDRSIDGPGQGVGCLRRPERDGQERP